MWRAVVALVHIDGKVTEEERSLIHRMTDNLNLTSAQRSTLDQDLEEGIVLEDILDQIIDHRDFSQLIKLPSRYLWPTMTLTRPNKRP